MTRKIRGRKLEIEPPTEAEREWIFQALQLPENHQPLGMARPPRHEEIRACTLHFKPDAEAQPEPVRFHSLRLRDTTTMVGFYIDFGWTYPTDPTREVQLVIADPEHRSMATYFDATMVVTQYLFCNDLAKRIRWRMHTRRSKPPKLNQRLGGRQIMRLDRVNLETGKPFYTYVYEGTRVEFEAMCDRLELDPKTQEYADIDWSPWEEGQSGPPNED